MRKLYAFMSVSLDGFFEGPDHDLSWHNVDDEFNDFAADMMTNTGVLLFGRGNYELMSSAWPNYQAKPGPGYESDAAVAERMNNLPKVVFSRTLDSVDWDGASDNIRLVKDNVAEEVIKLKQAPGKDLSAGGSNFCVSLLELGLLDEVWLMMTPVAIGQGTPLFQGLKKPLNLELNDRRQFKSDNVLLKYKVNKEEL